MMPQAFQSTRSKGFLLVAALAIVASVPTWVTVMLFVLAFAIKLRHNQVRADSREPDESGHPNQDLDAR